MAMKVRNHEYLRKNPHNGVVENINHNAYNQFITNRNRVLTNNERIDNLENTVSELKDMMNTLIQIVKEK